MILLFHGFFTHDADPTLLQKTHHGVSVIHTGLKGIRVQNQNKKLHNVLAYAATTTQDGGHWNGFTQKQPDDLDDV